MKHVIMTLALLGGCVAQAQIKPYVGRITKDNPEYKELYMNGSGKPLDDAKAFTSAINGEQVYRCVLQEVSMSKTGKGASLKNVKRKQ